MGSEKLYRRIRGEVERVAAVDMHEQLAYVPPGARRELDLFQLMGACHMGPLFERLGVPADFLTQHEARPAEKWRTVAPLLPLLETTGSYRALMVAARDLYGLADPKLDGSNWQGLTETIAARNREPDWCDRVLFERSNLQYVFNVTRDFRHEDPRVAVVPILTPILLATRADLWQNQAEQLGHTIEKLADAERCLEKFFERAEGVGAVGVWVDLSRARTMAVGNPSRAEASRVFRSRPDRREEADMKAYEDYVFHRALRLAADNELTVQIHTGIEDLGHDMLGNANPLLLNQIFSQYRHTRFVIDHAGYPFTGEAISLARCFANVYVDFVWMPLLSPGVTRRFLDEFLDLVPASKTMWGGDCEAPEAIYAQAVVTRNIVAEVLAERIERGTLTEETALVVAARILRDNALAAHKTDHLQPVETRTEA